MCVGGGVGVLRTSGHIRANEEVPPPVHGTTAQSTRLESPISIVCAFARTLVHNNEHTFVIQQAGT